MTTTDRPQRISFVPTAFFAEFLAGAREDFETKPRYDAIHRVSGGEAERITRIAGARVTGTSAS